MKKCVTPYFYSILFALGVGGLSALLTSGNMDIYSEITKPPLSPPTILFPIVWTLLFTLMGISAALVYCTKTASRREINSALLTYGLSLFVNFFWSIIFFNFRWFFAAFIWILLLIYLIIRTIMKYRRINPKSAYLQIPYLLWVGFATYLTFAIWLLNK